MIWNLFTIWLPKGRILHLFATKTYRKFHNREYFIYHKIYLQFDFQKEEFYFCRKNLPSTSEYPKFIIKFDFQKEESISATKTYLKFYSKISLIICCIIYFRINFQNFAQNFHQNSLQISFDFGSHRKFPLQFPEIYLPSYRKFPLKLSSKSDSMFFFNSFQKWFTIISGILSKINSYRIISKFT